MSKNNDNKKIPVISIVVVGVFVLGLGYYLFKSSPDQPKQQALSAEATNLDDNKVDSMHGGGGMAVNSDALNALIGQPMPEIHLTDKEGRAYTVDDFKGRNTVLFFNEGLMCYPACWNQMAAFGGDERFNTDQIQAISVVVDSAKDWQKAIDKMPKLGKAMTLFDSGAEASKELGILATESSMHRGSLPGHTYVVIDKEGVVRYVFDDPNMAIANDILFTKIGELQ